MLRTTRRTLGLLGAAGLAMSACGAVDGDDEAATGSSSRAPLTVTTVASSPEEDLPSGLSYALSGLGTDLPPPAVPIYELLSGGPPPDGIPSIDEPRFVAAGAVEFLADNEPVLALEVGGEARAYPVQILIWHEIVNDTVAGVPVSVTYCPLCNSALAYDRRVGERVLTFATSGLLWNSALVMYDRQTETLWSHFTGAGIVGVLTGTELETFPVATVPWAVWREAHPDGFVDDETGSVWNLLGRAVAGPLAGSSLTAIPHVDTFWFAWSTFLPDTELLPSEG